MMDFSNRCRGCLSNDEESLQPFEDTSLIQLFEECVRFQVSTGPYLPRRICASCYGKCTTWYKFRQQCLETNELINCKLSGSELETASVASIKPSEPLFKNEDLSGHEIPETVEEPCAVVPHVGREETYADEGSSEAVFSLDDELESAAEAAVEEEVLVETKSSGKEFGCPQCPALFRNIARFNAHWRQHQGRKPEVCTVCSKEFDSARALRRHKIKHVDGKQFTCPECGKSYKYANSLALHRKCHQEDSKKYICDICGKSFIRAYGLQSHMTSHSSDTPFKCNECLKQFKNEALLRNHVVRMHEGTRPYSCPTCEKAFKSSAELNIHIRSHTNDKPYKCQECDKCYKSPSHLAVHFRNAHTASRPFACDFCPLTFGYSKVLQCHRLIHTQEKPWQCSICRKNFRQKSTLDSHMRTHGPEEVPSDGSASDTVSESESESESDCGTIDVVESSQ